MFLYYHVAPAVFTQYNIYRLSEVLFTAINVNVSTTKELLHLLWFEES